MICKPVLLITGPTASGKTEIALAVAQKLPAAEILSADSRQFLYLVPVPLFESVHVNGNSAEKWDRHRAEKQLRQTL